MLFNIYCFRKHTILKNEGIYKMLSSSPDRFIYYPFTIIYEDCKMGMHTAKTKPLTKKERAEKRKKRKEKESAK
jgi:hypothetical protein